MAQSARRTPAQFEIHCRAFAQRTFLLGNGLRFFEREQVIRAIQSSPRTGPRTEIDAFGGFWLLGIGHLPPDLIAVRRQGGRIGLGGTTAIFLPPFSIVEWELVPGTYRWIGFTSNKTLPEGLGREAIAFPWTEARLPRTNEEVFDILARQRNPIPIEKVEKPSSVAARAKTRIDTGFTSDLKIEDLARELRVSRVVMTRAFRQAYGLSPVAYRTRLRIFHSLLHLGNGSTVTRSALAAGFSQISQYSRQFAKQMSGPPARFRPNFLPQEGAFP